MSQPLINAAGVYAAIPAERYHGDCCPTPSISSSIARLLTDECPAYVWHRSYLNPDYRREERTEFDIGSVTHLLVLEPEKLVDAVEILPFESFRTKAAQEARDAARADGRIPLLAAQWGTIHRMRDAIRHHPIGKNAFAQGVSELSLFWQDKETSVWCKCRPDWSGPNFAYLADLKTSTTANPSDFARKAYGLGYHRQTAWYLDGIEAATGERPKAFWFVVVDKEPPHLVSVGAFPPDYVEAGRALNRKAIRLFARCLERNEWPGYRQESTPDADTAFIFAPPRYADHQVASLLGA